MRPIDILTEEIAIEVTGVVGVSPALWYFSLSTLNVLDEGYSSHVLTLSVLDEGYSNLSTLNVLDEGYSRNTSCALSLISIYVFISSFTKKEYTNQYRDFFAKGVVKT